VNTNCLEGWKCPSCGNQDQFQIYGSALFDVTDDGSEAVGDHEWEGSSHAVCKRCRHLGTVDDFTGHEKKQEATQGSEEAAEFRFVEYACGCLGFITRSGKRFVLQDCRDMSYDEFPFGMEQSSDTDRKEFETLPEGRALLLLKKIASACSHANRYAKIKRALGIN